MWVWALVTISNLFWSFIVGNIATLWLLMFTEKVKQKKIQNNKITCGYVVADVNINVWKTGQFSVT